MKLKDRLKKIDNFFDDMSIEEFDTMIEKSGIYSIKSSSSYGMELKLNLSDVIEKNKEMLYLSQTETYLKMDKDLNLYNDYLVKAS